MKQNMVTLLTLVLSTLANFESFMENQKYIVTNKSIETVRIPVVVMINAIRSLMASSLPPFWKMLCTMMPFPVMDATVSTSVRSEINLSNIGMVHANLEIVPKFPVTVANMENMFKHSSVKLQK